MFFEKRRKQKFVNRLKYGQDKKPNEEDLIKSIIDGDVERSDIILKVLIKEHLQGRSG